MKNIERFKVEIAIMKIMDHPNIIKLIESFEDHRNIYLVMELCSNGDLRDAAQDSDSTLQERKQWILLWLLAAKVPQQQK